MELASSQQAADGFQSRGQAWDPLRGDILELLEDSRHADVAPIYYGSNHCFLVTLDGAAAGKSLAIYKPARGEYPLYDFPSGTLYKREVAAWRVNELLGWRIVPPTVITRGRYGAGSLQLFVESYTSGRVQLEELQRVALLDIALNNADRKAEHCLLGQEGKLWAIDHGLTFHAHPKLRTVLWHFAGDPLPKAEAQDLQGLSERLRAYAEPDVVNLSRLVDAAEWRALVERIDRMLAGGVFPNPRYKSVPYRW